MRTGSNNRLLCNIFMMALSLLFTQAGAIAETHYVDINSSNPVAPYTSWANAATSIQDAVDVSVPNDTVLVTNGVYSTGGAVTPGYTCNNRVVILNDIVLQSVNGPDVTFIHGAEATGGGCGTDAVRGVYMSAGLLSGFTITNGHTQTSGDYYYDSLGGEGTVIAPYQILGFRS